MGASQDDRARLREIARLIEVDSQRDDAQRDARFLHRFAERPAALPAIYADLRERMDDEEVRSEILGEDAPAFVRERLRMAINAALDTAMEGDPDA